MKVKKKDAVSKTLLFLVLISSIFMAVVVTQVFFIGKANADMTNKLNVNGIRVNSGNSIDIANHLTKHYNLQKKNYSLTLKHGDKKWQFADEDFAVSSNIHTIIETAQKIAKKEDIEGKIKLIKNLKNSGNSLEVSFNHIFPYLDEKINCIIEEIEVLPVGSEIKFNPNAQEIFEITESVDGIKVDKDKLYEEINQQFLNKKKIVTSIPTVEVKALVSKEENLKLTNKIASFKTNVADSTGGRKHNVKLALDKFNGLVVKPGEIVSFNKLTAPHSSANGYKKATIIYNGRFVDGVGGGICQASTTLYNALLLAGVKILEVNKHSLPVKYVPLALDAMVAEHISDLKFQNTSDYPIFIKTSSNSESVSVEIFSHVLPDNITYKTRSETIKKVPHLGDIIKVDDKKQFTDKVLFKGEFYRLSYPREGYEAKAYLQTIKDGKVIEEKEIRYEKYQPQNGIVIEGCETPHEKMQPITGDVNFIHASNSININEDENLIPAGFSP